MTSHLSILHDRIELPLQGVLFMHPLKGRKQSKEHVEKRMAAMRKHEIWPHGGPPKYNAERLWRKVLVGKIDDCWPWIGHRNPQGYGRVWLGGKGYYAHRVIFALANPGVIQKAAPKDRFSTGYIRHMCDNPSCCNPTHLLVGTHAENMNDKVIRGRSRWWESAVSSPRAKLTADDVRAIRVQFDPDNGTTRKALALLYDVSVPTIASVLSGRHYSDVI